MTSFINHPSVQQLFALFPKGTLRAVGGAVRDAVLKRRVHDVDFATSLHPNQVIEHLQKAGIKVKPTGIEHGTVMAILDGVGYEITTLRRDTETDGRHAVVHFTDSWEEDAARRDFTMNAMFMDVDGIITDYFNGQADAEARVIAFVGDAARRIEEDYLRILRYFRFCAQLGVTCDDDLLDVIRNHTDGLKQLSGERIAAEMLKLCASTHALHTLVSMQSCNVFAAIGLGNGVLCADSFERLSHITSAEVRAHVTLAVLLKETYSNAQTLAHAWRLPNKLSGVLELSEKVKNERMKWHDVAYYYGTSMAIFYVIVHGIKDVSIDHIEAHQPPTFPLTGRVLLEHGFKPGKEVGEVLKKCEKIWLNSDCQMTLEALIEQAQHFKTTL